MNTRSSRVSRGQKSKGFQGEGPNWILIAGSALLSTLTIRLGCRLKQALDTKQQANAATSSKGTKTSERRSAGYRVRCNMHSFSEDDDVSFNCISGEKHQQYGQSQMLSESNVNLPLATVSAPELSRENGIIWTSSPDRLELPQKLFHHSNCSDSPRVSESGSDIFSKREVIQKLRQQLKRRDDMVLEMQGQLVELQNSLNTQLAQSNHLQSRLDAANRDLFGCELEIQRLRKVIADHCLRLVDTNEKASTVTEWAAELGNNHANGENKYEPAEKGKGDRERIEMLKRESGELKELIEGKEFMLQDYKEQKTELSMKVMELQQRLDSQLPHIL